MSSADDPGADAQGLGQANQPPSDPVHSQLVEALIHLLIEKGVLTRNDALSIVQTVAQVQRGAALEARTSGARMRANVGMLQAMYQSFEAVPDRMGVPRPEADNVHQLRPPIHGDRPEFPRDD